MRTRELFHCPSPIRHINGPSTYLVDDDTLLGIEVESENCGLSIDTLQGSLEYWNTITDGSLKSKFPFEFVFRSPIQGATVEAALTELEDTLNGTSVSYPHNTSLHVHVDVSNMQIEELRSFLYLAVSLESALIRVSGNRKDNIFCMPFGKSDGYLLSSLGNSLDTEKNRHEDWTNNGKYSAVNFACVRNLGTVEFRSHVGTHSKQEITEWLNTILYLRKFAIESSIRGRAMDVLDYTTSNKTLKEFLCDIWPRSIVDQMLHRDLHEDVRASSFLARLSLFPKNATEFMSWVDGVPYKEGPATRDRKKKTLHNYNFFGSTTSNPFSAVINAEEEDDEDFDL